MEHSLFAMENPLMDIVAHVEPSFLERFGKRPGTMHLVDYPHVEALRAAIGSFRTVPGGSAANTARGIAWLSGSSGSVLRQSVLGRAVPHVPPVAPPVFNGAIGRDPTGDLFAAGMEKAQVRTSLVRKATATGTSVILVTPDGERTMSTFLGACRDFGPEDLDVAGLEASKILYLTGYLWDTENQVRAAQRAASVARAAGVRVAFDLADPFAVERSGEQLRAWMPGNVDILFGNRQEMALLTGNQCDEDCVATAAGTAPLVVMKAGADGCLVAWEHRVAAVPAVSARVVDTTGAGDAFAAGFLFGLLAGADPVSSARLANALAGRVVEVEGCDYESL
jgi:sugar/nucleoside kinase (ribokinase family)